MKISRPTHDSVSSSLLLFICCLFLGKDDIFGNDIKDRCGSEKSVYCVRALSYCDINKIELKDLDVIFKLYPEFADRFYSVFQVTFHLKHVSISRRITETFTCIFIIVHFECH